MSIRQIACAVAGSLALVGPALALDVQERVLQVSYKHLGQDYVYNDAIVPLLPGNACYTWYIRLGETDTEVTAIERLRLPVAIDWGTMATDPTDDIEIKERGTVAETTLPATTDAEGWFSHGWCVAAGDPLGRHSIEVTAGTQRLATFDFDVVDPEDYNFPVAAAATSPWAARSANRVW